VTALSVSLHRLKHREKAPSSSQLNESCRDRHWLGHKIRVAVLLIGRSLVRAQVGEPDKAGTRPLLGVAFLLLWGLYWPQGVGIALLHFANSFGSTILIWGDSITSVS